MTKAAFLANYLASLTVIVAVVNFCKHQLIIKDSRGVKMVFIWDYVTKNGYIDKYNPSGKQSYQIVTGTVLLPSDFVAFVTPLLNNNATIQILPQDMNPLTQQSA